MSPQDHFLCVARTPEADWLGTKVGIKIIDRRTKQKRLVLGLPTGEVVAIAPEAALVRAKGALQCWVAEATGRWRLVGELPAGTASAVRGWSEVPLGGHVAVSASQVAFVPRVLKRDTPVFALLVSRAGKGTPLGWDPALRADHSEVRVSFAHLIGDILWLGTDLGLLTTSPGQPWQRVLAGEAIDTGSGQAGKLWLASHARGIRRPEGNPDWPTRQPDLRWSLRELSSLAIGRLLATHEPASPPFHTIRYANALVRTGEGALWLTVMGTEGLEMRIMKAQMLASTAFHRWNGKSWLACGLETLAQVPDEALFGLLNGPYAPYLEQPPGAILSRFPHWLG